MNAEQVLEIVRGLRDALDGAQIESKLQQLEAAIQQVVNQPASSGPAQEQMKTSTQLLREELQHARENEKGPVWRQAVIELNLTDVLAESIERQLNSIFQDVQLTPAIALKEVRVLREKIVQTKAKMNQAAEGLEFLGFHEAAIPAGKAEISMLVPRVAVENSLDIFSKELRTWNNLLKVIGEAANENVEDIQIRSIASSELLVTILTDCRVVAVFADALSKLVGCYTKILKVRKLRDEMKDLGVSNDHLAGVESDVKGRWQDCIDNAVRDALKGQRKGTQGRRNELKTLLNKAMWKLVDDLDKGYHFDVRANDEGKSTDEDAEKTADEIINEIRASLDFVPVAGHNIISLPPGQEILGDADATKIAELGASTPAVDKAEQGD